MWMFVRQPDASSERSRAAVWLDARRISQISTYASDALRRAIPRTYAIEHLLVAIAVVSLSWYAFASISAAREHAALTTELEHLRFPASVSPPEPGRSTLRARLAPGTLIGRIDVPRLKLSALAREGADVQTLRTAVGHVSATALPGDIGNAAFAGHRDTVFRNLEGVRTGDEILVTTASGTYQYIVTGTRIVAPTQTSVIATAKGRTLTLITSYPFDYIGTAPERFIVGAEAVAPNP